MSLLNPLHRPYPDDVYTADGGEVSAWLRPPDAPPELTYTNGGSCEYLATGDATGGLYGLYRWSFGKDESGPDPHFHRSITESFYVLEGRVRLFDGARWVTAGAGNFLHVPEGGIHGFRAATTPGCCCSSRPARPGRTTSRRSRRWGGAAG